LILGVFSFPEREETGFGGEAGGALLDVGLGTLGDEGREGLEVGAKLGAEQLGGDARGQNGEQGTQGSEGEDGVFHPALDDLGHVANLVGEVLGLGDDHVDEALQTGEGDGMAMLPMLQGLEIAIGAPAARGPSSASRCWRQRF